MFGEIDPITLISLIVAVVAILKLRSVLGRRTGDEETRIERVRAEHRERAAASDKVVTLPRREGAEAYQPAEADGANAVAEVEAKIRSSYSDSVQPVQQGLLEILRQDPSFDPQHFTQGAKAAYEMIVTAFAEGNRRLLKDLLDTDVYEGFVAAIADRESRGEQIDQSFVGIEKADIVEAELRKGVANITVRFVSQLISATRDRNGEIISGDDKRVKDVTDIWTFSRDMSSARALANPNWKLVATQASN
jgi:predicted lipid-binding transport protein (Tim44 family)